MNVIKNTTDDKIRNNNMIRNGSDQMISDKNYQDNVNSLTASIVDFAGNYQKGHVDKEAKIFQKQTSWINQENRNSRLFAKLQQFNGTLLFGEIMTNVIRDIIQHDKQSKKVEQPQQQHRLIHDRGKRQKRFSTKKSEQTEWFQWPGPCNNDNNCPPNLYCVNGSCWHLLDKPIRIQQVHRQHDPSINAEEQKKSDISHLAIESLYRSVGDASFTTKSEELPKIESVITNLSKFRNSHPFDYKTNTTTSTTATTTAFHQPNTKSPTATSKSKTTNSNNQNIRQQLITTTNKRIQTDELPVYTEYTRQRRFGQPIRIELYLARAVLHDECSQDSHCGHRMICCRKRWYDLSADSGTGYFCLPDCGLTKKVNLEIHEANGSIPNDIIYD